MSIKLPSFDTSEPVELKCRDCGNEDLEQMTIHMETYTRHRIVGLTPREDGLRFDASADISACTMNDRYLSLHCDLCGIKMTDDIYIFDITDPRGH